MANRRTNSAQPRDPIDPIGDQSYNEGPSFRSALGAPVIGSLKSSPKTRIDRTGRDARLFCCLSTGDDDVATGTVKWFNPSKGYGFIQPQAGGKDGFVHISAVERAGLSTLNEGAVVDYEVVANKGKESAENIKVK